MNQENSACALIGQLSFVFSFAIISSKRLFGKTGGYLESSVYGPLKAPAHTNLSTTHVNIIRWSAREGLALLFEAMQSESESLSTSLN
jgi:hypothetical protein